MDTDAADHYKNNSNKHFGGSRSLKIVEFLNDP